MYLDNLRACHDEIYFQNECFPFSPLHPHPPSTCNVGRINFDLISFRASDGIWLENPSFRFFGGDVDKSCQALIGLGIQLKSSLKALLCFFSEGARTEEPHSRWAPLMARRHLSTSTLRVCSTRSRKYFQLYEFNISILSFALLRSKGNCFPFSLFPLHFESSLLK